MVEFKKKITQCRECPNCRIVPDWFNDDDEKALCKETGDMLRPYEKVAIPNWCPLKTN